MSNRNFDSRAIIQRLQNQVYSRNLYTNNTTSQTLINNPQTTDGNSSRYSSYHSGSQTEYSRGLLGSGETISVGGIIGIPPSPSSSLPTPSITVPDAPTNLIATPDNGQVSISFTQGSDGGSPIINYLFSVDGGITFYTFRPLVSTSPVIISGLTNGITYSIKLKTLNAIGTSEASEAVSAMPTPIILSFTTVGTTSWTAPEGITSVEYLVVGGGGGSGGGFDTGGGGGGGGGMVLSGTMAVIPGNTYTITVGDGGIGGISIRSPVSETNGSSGDNSSFDSIIALGGSGGYASRQPIGGNNSSGGTGAIHPTTASEGGHGGGSAGDGNGAGGGGGGSSGNGSNGVSNTGGNGGNGTTSVISGSSVSYGNGGRGANGNSNNSAIIGASNTGNGARGGGAASFADENGAKGGSGIVIIRF